MLGFMFNVVNDAFLVIIIGLVDAFMRAAAERYNSDV